MGADYNIFIKYEDSVDSLVLGLEKILGVKLRHTRNRDLDYYSTVVLGVGVSLVSPLNWLEDDIIEYSRYGFTVMVEYRANFDGEYKDILPLFTEVLANMIFRELKCECLAVQDLTNVLAEFKPD